MRAIMVMFYRAVLVHQGVRTIRVPGRTLLDAYQFGTLLFDLEVDPAQQHPIQDDEVELRMMTHLVELMRESDAPVSQYECLGLPARGPVTAAQLQVRAQTTQAARSTEPQPRPEEFPEGRLSVRTSIHELLGDRTACEILRRHVPIIAHSEVLQAVGTASLLDLAAVSRGAMPLEKLRAIATELADVLATETNSASTTDSRI
ncbi:MAG: sulfatase [Nocardia sp.]|uniref:hypothetical protein n=1 Tax=Nocardia sp. TaxID=1821 RepID=UPI002621ED57|nr:hypothetical protein [Nocardia sp.]MCU1642534.1 sulfatase [Nocardia sp.]